MSNKPLFNATLYVDRYTLTLDLHSFDELQRNKTQFGTRRLYGADSFFIESSSVMEITNTGLYLPGNNGRGHETYYTDKEIYDMAWWIKGYIKAYRKLNYCEPKIIDKLVVSFYE